MRWLAVAVAAAALLACGGDDGKSPKATSPVSRSASTIAEDADIAPLTVESDAFGEGEPIPERFTCEGENLSPALSWDGVVYGTLSLVVVVDDPDAPGGTFTHWLLYDLPRETQGLPEDLDTGPLRPVGGVQGTNDSGNVGYTGPCPPQGQTHTYVFTVYALRKGDLELESGASADEVHAAIEGYVVAQGELTGTFGR